MCRNISIWQIIIARLWWSPFRRPFEALARRTIGKRSRIFCGPLKGSAFSGGLAQILGIYELHLQKIIAGNLNSGGVFYDIGANNGFISLLGSQKVGAQGYVYAFEPLPYNVEKLQKVVAHNKVKNCNIIPVAVSSESGIAELYYSDDKATATPTLMNGQGGMKVNVRTITLDSFIRDHRQPDLIKLDVEGAEALVLEGASALLSGDRAPDWVIEVHSEECNKKVRKLLDSSGYSILKLESVRPKSYPHHILAIKRPPK
jgi:FkbM family methyltransferase